MSIDIESLNDDAIAAIIKDQIEKRNFNTVKKYLTHKSPKIRSYAIESLSKYAFEIDMTDALKKGIKDQDQGVRLHTLRSLKDIFKRAEEKKEKWTMNPDGTSTRVFDPEGLWMQFNNKYFPIIIIALQDETKWVKSETISLLAQIGNPVTVGYLVQLLKTSDEDFRREITSVLERRLYEYDWGKDSKEALSPLLDALKDNDPYIRLNAVTNLKVTGEYGYKYLVQSLKDREPSVRVEACNALARTRDPMFLQDLLELTKDENRDVRESAKNALITLLGVETRY